MDLIHTIEPIRPAFDPLWYAVVLRSRFERKTHASLVEVGIESFLPLIEELHTWSDRKKIVQEPLFRGYLFVKTDMRHKVEVLEKPGVVRFVEFGAKPVPIPEHQIEWIRLALREPRQVAREPYFGAGDRVRVIAGPLAGLEGIILQTRGHCRLVISLSAIAQSFSVEVTEECVEKVVEVDSRQSTVYSATSGIHC